MTAHRVHVTAGLATSERLVLTHLRDAAHAPTDGRRDLTHVADCLRLPLPVVAASVDALLARRLLHRHADGRIVVIAAPHGRGGPR